MNKLYRAFRVNASLREGDRKRERKRASLRRRRWRNAVMWPWGMNLTTHRGTNVERKVPWTWAICPSHLAFVIRNTINIIIRTCRRPTLTVNSDVSTIILQRPNWIKNTAPHDRINNCYFFLDYKLIFTVPCYLLIFANSLLLHSVILFFWSHSSPFPRLL